MVFYYYYYHFWFPIKRLIYVRLLDQYPHCLSWILGPKFLWGLTEKERGAPGTLTRSSRRWLLLKVFNSDFPCWYLFVLARGKRQNMLTMIYCKFSIEDNKFQRPLLYFLKKHRRSVIFLQLTYKFLSVQSELTPRYLDMCLYVNTPVLLFLSSWNRKLSPVVLSHNECS